jgi:hypothetical protein
MTKENQDFCAGILIGVLISCIIVTIAGILKCACENSGYDNKLVIQYHSPNKEYDRQVVQDMVNDSGIWTNFVCRETKMGKWRIEWRMTNPENYKRQGARQ